VEVQAEFTAQFKSALEVFIGGTDLVGFNRGLRKLVHRRLVALIWEGLVDTDEIEVLKDLELLYDCLDIMENQC